MPSSGAPTGTWETLPEHLREDAGEIDPGTLSPRLKVRRPGTPEVEIPIDKSGFTIGRDPDEVDLVLDDDLVSRRHAALTFDARGYVKLQDLGSSNGMKFHGRTVRRLNLVDGDVFHIGRIELEFHAAQTRFGTGAGVGPAPDAPTTRPAARDASVMEPPVPRGASDELDDALGAMLGGDDFDL